MKGAGKYKKVIVILALVWGFVLAVGGFIYGNQAVIQPNLDQYEQTIQKEKISANMLNCWITNKRTDFKIVEFAEQAFCSDSFDGLSNYRCYDSKLLSDTKSLRQTFRKLDRQYIVLGTNAKNSLYASAQLKHLGYKVRMLEDANTISINPVTTQPMTPLIQHPVTAEPVSTYRSSNEDELEENEELEEEGC